MSEAEVLATLAGMFGGETWPRAVRFLHGVYLVRRGMPVSEAARAIRTNTKTLQAVLNAPDLVRAALGGEAEITDVSRKKARRAIGQMVVGRAAEAVFMKLFHSGFTGEELEIDNVTDAATDTDLRILNGRKRYLYRINIKFFGSAFRRAVEIVGLKPEDCFALATYKIRSGREKQEAEGKPYFFAIVGVPGLTADAVGDQLAADVIDVTALVISSSAEQRRRFEDAVVDHAVKENLTAYAGSYAQIYEAPWYILSAVRAEKLMRDKLFERVPALTIRNFTNVFRGAEVDMHFSLREDLTPLSEFFRLLKDEGREHVATLISRGDL